MKQYSTRVSNNFTKLLISGASLSLIACAPLQPQTSQSVIFTAPTSSPIDNNIKPKCATNSDQIQCAFIDGINEPFSGAGFMPIEGLTAGLIMRKFGGITAADFDGVQTSQGVYYNHRGELRFNFTGEFEHSAARTISKQGFAHLRRNIENRLGVRTTNPHQVRQILKDLKG